MRLVLLLLLPLCSFTYYGDFCHCYHLAYVGFPSFYIWYSYLLQVHLLLLLLLVAVLCSLLNGA
jgi:hypothetical protein